MATRVPQDEPSPGPGYRARVMDNQVPGRTQAVTENDRLPLALLVTPEDHPVPIDREFRSPPVTAGHPVTNLARSITTVRVGFSSAPPSLPIACTTPNPSETVPTTA